MVHHEIHKVHRVGWLRAAVLGANDGIVSTASLILGVAAAGAASGEIFIAGLAGLVAGAMSMAAGEYISVSAQADIEAADLRMEKHELKVNPDAELAELTAIYVERGLDHALAREVAIKLTAHDALGAHARDELGLNEITRARPLQAAMASALSFAVGAAVPLLLVWLTPVAHVLWSTGAVSLLLLLALGAVSALSGGAPVALAMWRVGFWGALAMGLTAAVGLLFGAV